MRFVFLFVFSVFVFSVFSVSKSLYFQLYFLSCDRAMWCDGQYMLLSHEPFGIQSISLPNTIQMKRKYNRSMRQIQYKQDTNIIQMKFRYDTIETCKCSRSMRKIELATIVDKKENKLENKLVREIFGRENEWA